ncbi:Proline-rich protein PRCC [Ananas comosus]|uniref:Proline-rich protein PRCC n=2 Tax=Ananas comosus TaxID=4615 RepID=A0A199VTG6_ANACO|nr:Proline-rich protein PRCC [Ananas comosus]
MKESTNPSEKMIKNPPFLSPLPSPLLLLSSPLSPPKSLPPPTSSPNPTNPNPRSSQPNSIRTLNPEPSKPQARIFSSLQPPKTSSSSSLFSSLPPPKSKESSNPLSLDFNPKKVVRFTPPVNPRRDLDDEDDEDEVRKRKPANDSSSTVGSKKNLSSMLPAPKNSLCLAPSAASSIASRRSAVEAESAAVSVKELESEQEGSGFEGYGGYSSSWVGASAEAEAAETIAYESYGAYNGGWASDPTASAEGGAEGAMASGFSSSSYGSADASQWEQSYGSGVDYGGGYEGSWSDGSIDRGASVVADVGMSKGKRGRNEMPIEIVEVKQEELVKNRPREDQAKLTGIAFGPSYQPVSSAKGKPSKLQKRKHQIGSLYFDMKQKEMELSERRARGFLTKAETQAKYGW